MVFSILCVGIALTWWNPPAPYEQALHHSLTVLGFGLWYVYMRHYRMSRWAFILVTILVALHSIGARWMYSFVPYDDWFQTLFGNKLSPLMGWQRNHYDRLVHLAYGFCFVPAITEWLQQRYRLKLRMASWIALAFIMLTGLWYEWFEWGAAMVLSPEDTEAYNGQQGDMWDSHKDTLIASFGGFIGVLSRRLWGNRY
ncbi:MAG: hypothetical protein H6R05_974 [Burkholderiaceae bacterium]|nr:hypothetical protein [Burkholderiaceae bacterium]